MADEDSARPTTGPGSRSLGVWILSTFGLAIVGVQIYVLPEAVSIAFFGEHADSTLMLSGVAGMIQVLAGFGMVVSLFLMRRSTILVLIALIVLQILGVGVILGAYGYSPALGDILI